MKKINKKGFTLVELLAVIVILALIMAIAVVSMSGIMTGARKSTMKETALQIINGVRQQLTLSNQLVASQNKFTRDTGNVYYVSKAMLEKGGDSAPLGGTYSFITTSTSPKTTDDAVTQIGSSGIYEATNAVAANACNGTNLSFVRVKNSGGNWVWSICLTASGEGATTYPYITDSAKTVGSGNNAKTFSAGTEENLLKSDKNDMIVDKFS